VRADGSRYYPAFPYPNFTKLTRQDIFAIRAYLATLTPVSNAPRAPELRFPFNYRFVMRGWNWLFFKPGILMPDQQKSAEWNRGRYLVEGVAHCGACHTPKNMFGADRRGQAFGGGRVAGHVRAPAGRRRAQRVEILERGRHRRISAERPQRQEPCRRIDVGGRGQFDLKDERCGCQSHRGLPERPAGGRAGAEGHPAHSPRKWRKARNSTTAPASPATRKMARARRGSIRRCPATPICNPPTP
jgi:mono/diheme cytochrome c family protein